MTDEQLREQFEQWAEGIDMAPDFAAEREKCPDDPTYGWNYGKLTAWEAWQARDAEVQALREELLNYVSADEMAGGEGYGTYPNSEHRRIRALVAGGEGTNHE